MVDKGLKYLYDTFLLMERLKENYCLYSTSLEFTSNHPLPNSFNAI